jgi:hypothetical protein
VNAAPPEARRGLSAEQARAALERVGPNALPEPRQPRFTRRLADQVRNPLVRLLGAAGLLSVLLG